LQSWFSRIHPGASPFRLYALSNVGSLQIQVAARPPQTNSIRIPLWTDDFTSLFQILHVKKFRPAEPSGSSRPAQ